MFISVIIPTKNRANDLFFAIKSIVSQSRLPNQLIVIDQSESNDSEELITSKIPIPINLELKYVRDITIKGLVEAKSKSLNYAKGDIICFLEDDIILDYNFIKEIENSFVINTQIFGCSGIITNETSSNLFYRLFYRLTHVGIFKDERPHIFYKLKNKKNILYKTNAINGGLSAWRKEVFSYIDFDFNNKFHMMEDFDFSFRVNKLLPNSLFINSNAKLVHNFSPVNRNIKTKAFKQKIFEYIVYFKKNNVNIYEYISLFFLLIGLFFQAIIFCIKDLNPIYLFYYFHGIFNGTFHKIILK